jgi:cytochrome c oxidase cbb3-type subunit III
VTSWVGRLISSAYRRYRWPLGLAVLIIFGLFADLWRSERALLAELLIAEPARILGDPMLLRKAVRIGKPQFERHCVSCHGEALQGDPARGVPDLARHAWLYGNDPSEVERTILYGIRSGHPKARNVTDMPALIRTGQITKEDGDDAIEFLLSLAGRPHDEAAALRGRSIYYNKGNCYDCHASDAKGVNDYGTPALTGPVYLYGGDRKTLYLSILNGRHGECPAWIERLTALQIRALALYMVCATSPPPRS